LNFNEVSRLIEEHRNTRRFGFLAWCLFAVEHWYSIEFSSETTDI
jgi:hypothetical protein